ncbi:MAG: CHAT domain-containing protein, partial [Bacteroidetes bacterium]|nr:CHAT domain-containing protein [Bacteroidota bacterium]
SKMPFLIKESEILYAISLNDYLTVTEDKNTKSVLGFFPVFSNSTKELPYSLEESNTLQKIMKATIFKEERATASQFIESAAQFDILHISSHANGGTFTHPASVDFADRTLTLDELYGLPLSSELVVLSACETGVGKAIKGEGVQSVARAFQYSGAKNVLFSLWKVNDYSTAWLMEHFYREYKEGMTSTNSLQKIAMDYLTDDTIDNAKKSPYYWAAFVSYGKAETTFQDSKYLWVYLAILLSGIAGFFLFRRQKNVIN